MPVEYINVIIKRQFWCVCAITENCAGCVWLKCSSGSKLIQQEFISILQTIFFLPSLLVFHLSSLTQFPSLPFNNCSL